MTFKTLPFTSTVCPVKVRSQKLNEEKMKSLRHQVFPGGPPSKYYPGPTLLNFRDQTRTGAFIVVWLQTTTQLKKKVLFRYVKDRS